MINVRKINARKIFSHTGWAISGGVALILSAYSLFYVGKAWGMPPYLAGMVSVVLDGAAIVSADMALRASRKHGKGGVDRLLTIAFAGVSAWINSYHARLVHAGGAAWALYALPPIVAVVLFDRHTRSGRRATPVSSLPRIKWAAWLLFPVQSFRILRSMVGDQLFELTGTEAITKMSNASEVRMWAQGKGLKVGDKGKIADPVWAAWEKEQNHASKGS
jgi:hypothetical protein